MVYSNIDGAIRSVRLWYESNDKNTVIFLTETKKIKKYRKQWIPKMFTRVISWFDPEADVIDLNLNIFSH